jgi:glutamyl-tRNA reductase
MQLEESGGLQVQSRRGDIKMQQTKTRDTPPLQTPSQTQFGTLISGPVAGGVTLPTLAPPMTPQKKLAAEFGMPIVIGLSHKTASVNVREQLSIKEPDWNAAAAALCQYDSINEAAILSTCNRFEVYIVAVDHFAATQNVMDFLRDHSKLPDIELRPNLFVKHDKDAAWHLLRVTAGLESLVVGEGQILSQVKACYANAVGPAGEDGRPAGSAGKVLGRLLNTAVMAGKFVRSETDIGKGAVSISSAAVELAIKKAPTDLNQSLEDLRVTVVGAGKMSRLLMTHLVSKGVTELTLVNRSRESAEELAAQYDDLTVDIKLMDEFWPAVRQSDLVFTSTSASILISKADLEAGADAGAGPAQQGGLMLVDISVPRNISADAGEVPGVFAYNVDDLKEVVNANRDKRAKKVMEAELLLRVELGKFVQWQESLCYVPVLRKLQGQCESVRKAEVEKLKKKGLKGCSKKELDAVDVATKSLINKLLHGPMVYLRADDMQGTKAAPAEIEAIFGIHDKE